VRPGGSRSVYNEHHDVWRTRLAILPLVRLASVAPPPMGTEGKRGHTHGEGGAATPVAWFCPSSTTGRRTRYVQRLARAAVADVHCADASRGQTSGMPETGCPKWVSAFWKLVAGKGGDLFLGYRLGLHNVTSPPAAAIRMSIVLRGMKTFNSVSRARCGRMRRRRGPSYEGASAGAGRWAAEQGTLLPARHPTQSPSCCVRPCERHDPDTLRARSGGAREVRSYPPDRPG